MINICGEDLPIAALCMEAFEVRQFRQTLWDAFVESQPKKYQTYTTKALYLGTGAAEHEPFDLNKLPRIDHVWKSLNEVPGFEFINVDGPEFKRLTAVANLFATGVASCPNDKHFFQNPVDFASRVAVPQFEEGYKMIWGKDGLKDHSFSNQVRYINFLFSIYLCF